MMRIYPPAKGLPLLLTFSFLLVNLNVFAQAKFKVGDRVEASYAGDWLRAVVVGGYQENEFGSTYEVKYDGYSATSRINSKYVRPLFRPDAGKTFKAGDRVEFRRWDDSIHEGEIVGVDGKRYEIRYTLNGFPNKEWIDEISVRPSQKAVVVNNSEKPAPKKEELKGPANVPGKAWAGQRFNIGDRVMYDDVGFLVTKSFGTVISVDAEKRMYTIRNEKDPSSRYSYACYEVMAPNEKPTADFFIGKWEVFVSGAMTSKEKDDKVTYTITGGMKLPPLEIKANGTYTWVANNKKVIKGLWKLRTDVPGITLLKGLDGLDWTVYENTEALAATRSTRDEIRFHHLPSSTGYYMAYRIGANKSCVLTGRKF